VKQEGILLASPSNWVTWLSFKSNKVSRGGGMNDIILLQKDSSSNWGFSLEQQTRQRSRELHKKSYFCVCVYLSRASLSLSLFSLNPSSFMVGESKLENLGLVLRTSSLYVFLCMVVRASPRLEERARIEPDFKNSANKLSISLWKVKVQYARGVNRLKKKIQQVSGWYSRTAGFGIWIS